VAINKVGDVVILMPKGNKWAGFINGLSLFDEDFMSEGREQPAAQEREPL
jgi:antitoxin VapB